MAVVSTVAFAVAALCFYFGARALRTRRAIERLRRRERRRGDALAWLDPSDGTGSDSRPDADPPGRVEAEEQRRDGVSVERGFVLLALGLGCALLGVISL